MERRAAMSERRQHESTIDACREGDREAFRMLFELYKDKVYSIAYHYMGDEAAARDVTQQVFLKLMDKVGQFQHNAEFSTWLYRLVANACLDERRKTKRLVPFETLEAVEPDSAASCEDQLLRREV